MKRHSYDSGKIYDKCITRESYFCILMKASSEHGFVTMHDYVSTIHPWLMSLRKDILESHLHAFAADKPLPPETEFVVEFGFPATLTIDLKEDKYATQKGGVTIMTIPIH